jgi:hypothetical protein
MNSAWTNPGDFDELLFFAGFLYFRRETEGSLMPEGGVGKILPSPTPHHFLSTEVEFWTSHDDHVICKVGLEKQYGSVSAASE